MFAGQRAICRTGFLQQQLSDLIRLGAGVLLQQQCGGAADEGRCHGCSAHTDIVGADDILSAAARQGKIKIRRKDGNDIIPRCPQVRQGWFFSGKKSKGGGKKIIPVLPCPYGDDAATDGGRRAVSTMAVGISGGGHHHDAHLPKPFHGFLQGKVDPSVVGADGKIDYFYIIFAEIVHYPSQCPYSLSGISLSAAVKDLDGNDICMRRNAAVFSAGKKAVSAGHTRDVAHGRRKKDFLAFCVYLR